MRKQFKVLKTFGAHVQTKRIGNHTVTEIIPRAVLLCNGERRAIGTLNFIGEDKHKRPIVTKKRTHHGKLRAWIDRGKRSPKSAVTRDHIG